jgi:hypothetical protein
VLSAIATNRGINKEVAPAEARRADPTATAKLPKINVSTAPKAEQL